MHCESVPKALARSVYWKLQEIMLLYSDLNKIRLHDAAVPIQVVF